MEERVPHLSSETIDFIIDELRKLIKECDEINDKRALFVRLGINRAYSVLWNMYVDERIECGSLTQHAKDTMFPLEKIFSEVLYRD